MSYITTIKVSPQGQITIPKIIREKLKIKKGAKLIAQLNDDVYMESLTLTIEPKSWVDYMAGIGKGLWGDVDEYIKKERASWDRKWD